MSFSRLLEMTKVFHQNILLFGIMKDNILIACSICILVNKNYLYVFYWGELPNLDQYHPYFYYQGLV